MEFRQLKNPLLRFFLDQSYIQHFVFECIELQVLNLVLLLYMCEPVCHDMK
jgi:hypothetical protein